MRENDKRGVQHAGLAKYVTPDQASKEWLSSPSQQLASPVWQTHSDVALVDPI